MRRVLLLAALSLGLGACASTKGLGAPSERVARQTGWRPITSVPVKPLAGPPRKPVLTGGMAMKPITQ